MTHDRIADIWGPTTPYAAGEPWPARVDTFLAEGTEASDVDRWVQSACLLCSNGCGVDIAVSGGRMVGVRGREADRVSRGRLGPKGLFGWQGQQHDRLTRPLVRRGGRLVETSWDEAMGLVVERSRALLDSKGALSHGFYTSGQLMLEEYYTLAVIGKAGIGTPHMDGNTRLCTATAAAALKESFGTDGQPGSYTDLDVCDAVFHYGHNVAETQTVLWARMLDRLEAPNPPLHVCVDPRRTKVAERSDVHLAVRPGTNQAVMNGLIRELIHRDWVDHDYVAAHTHGFDELAKAVEPYTPQKVAEICLVSARDVERAGRTRPPRRRCRSTTCTCCAA
jgi:anaerobic selenocysteine-containing dehydrogenase